MPINEVVKSYTVATLRNDLVTYRYKITLELASSATADLLFPDSPPAQYLYFSGGHAVAYLPASQFKDTYHLLQTESPVYFTALNLFGIRAVTLSTGKESLGEGLADQDALAALLGGDHVGAAT